MDKELRILLLEDVPTDADLTARELRQAGLAFTIRRVQTEEAFVQALAEFAPDLILSDYSLPRFDGHAALKIAQVNCPNAPFIFVSGTLGEEAAIDSLKLGATDYVLKNRLSRLAPAVKRALREAEERRERQRVEEKLRLSDEILQRIGTLVLVADTQGLITYIGPSVRTILGYEPSGLLGDGWWKLSRDNLAEREREKSYLARCARGEIQPNEEPYERPVKRRDGERRWILWQDAKGPAATIIGVGHDITERKQRERELEAIATVATALRAAPTRADMLPVILNEVLALLKADGAALVMRSPIGGDMVVALARGAWANWTGMRIVPGEGLSGHIVALASTRPYLNNDVMSDPRLARPNLIENLRALACVQLIAEKQPIGVLGIGRKTEIAESELHLLAAMADIAANALHRAHIVETLEQRVTERTRELAEANERLKEFDRMKDQFVSNVSHELRTPLANVKVYLGLLDHGRAGKREEYMATLQRETVRLESLIENLLDLSRLDLGAAPLHALPTNLHQLISQLVIDRSNLTADRGLSLAYKPDLNLPPALVDPLLIAQVISNLVTNAMNYTPSGGTITLETAVERREADHDWITLAVRDTGPGISAKDLAHLFERFYRGEAGRRSRTPGTGLGLAICKAIVDRLEGRITVDSQPGQGSTFTVWLRPADSSEDAH